MQSSSVVSKAVRIRVTVVGGYLGAGKTTLLSHMLSEKDMSDCVFLINDFGDFNIDDALVSSKGGETIELKNGCICCSLVDGLVSALLKLVKASPRPKRIIIEASGVSDPEKIADIARLSKSLELDKVVVLVDAKKIEETIDDPLIGDIVSKQLSSADMLVLNKTEGLEHERVKMLMLLLEEKSPDVTTYPTEFSVVPINTLLTSTPFKNGEFTRELMVDNDVSEASLAFKHWSFSSIKPLNRVKLSKLLDSLPSTVQRMKGLVRFESAEDEVYLLQMTPGAWSISHQAGVDLPQSVSKLNVIGNKYFSNKQFDKLFEFAMRV